MLKPSILPVGEVGIRLQMASNKCQKENYFTIYSRLHTPQPPKGDVSRAQCVGISPLGDFRVRAGHNKVLASENYSLFVVLYLSKVEIATIEFLEHL